MTSVIGNTFTMAHFHDFYFVEAMRGGIAMAKSANPELAFSHSVERLETDVENMFSYLSENIALRVYVYLYAASLGEARHANDLCNAYIPQLRGTGRDAVYSKALSYYPSENNTSILQKIFSQKWRSSGFGGKNWLNIVNGMLLYGKVTNATFIDHAVDLHHNSGSVFTKSTSNIAFQCFGSYDYSTLQSFLDWKFRADILNDGGKYNRFDVSTKVYRLLSRYSHIIADIKAVNYCRPELEFLTPYEVEWGYSEFDFSGDYVESTDNVTIDREDEDDYQECHFCENHIDPSDHYHDKFSNCICRECYENMETCDKCSEKVRRTYTVDGRKQWCNGCLQYHAHCCDNCGNWTTDTMHVCQDNGYQFCENCADHAHYCEKCNEYYHNIDQHNEDEHLEPEEINAPLWVDGDGFFETVEPVKEFVYHVASFKYNLGVKIMNLNEAAYEIPGSGFVVTNVEIERGKIRHCNKWSVTNITSGYNLGKYYSKHDAFKIVKAVKDIVDWNTITNQSDYDALPESKKDEIKHAKYYATW